MNASLREDIFNVAVLLVLCALLLGFQLGKTGLIDPDEPFYSLTAKEMLAQHEMATPLLFGKPQFEKPILFYWVLYGFFRWLGVSEFSARLGPCLAGAATVLITYFWAKLLFRRRRLALVSAVVLAVSAQFVILSRIVLTDIFLCLFVTAALFCFSLGERDIKHRPLYWNLIFVFSALGFLTKGPLGLLIPLSGIVAYACLDRDCRMLKEIPWLSGGALFALIALPWYGLMAWEHGVGFLRHFFIHENLRRFFIAEHLSADKATFYPLTVFFGFFPWSGFLIPALLDANRKSTQRLQSQWHEQYLFLWYSFLVPFIFFAVAKSKLMSYVFPVYPIAAILIGAWMFRLYRAIRLKAHPKLSLIVANFLVWAVLPSALVVGAFRFTGKNGDHAHTPLIFISLTMIPLLWASFYLLCKKKYQTAFSVAILAMIFLSMLSFGWLLPKIEDMISSKKWAKGYEKYSAAQPGAELLTSKMFLRGMSFYSENPRVGVLSGQPDAGFYTPHPIDVISDAEGLSRMTDSGAPVYLLLREKEWKFLNNLDQGRYSLFVLEAANGKKWVRLEHV